MRKPSTHMQGFMLPAEAHRLQCCLLSCLLKMGPTCWGHVSAHLQESLICSLSPWPVNDSHIQPHPLHHVNPQVAELAIAEGHHLVTCSARRSTQNTAKHPGSCCSWLASNAAAGAQAVVAAQHVLSTSSCHERLGSTHPLQNATNTTPFMRCTRTIHPYSSVAAGSTGVNATYLVKVCL